MSIALQWGYNTKVPSKSKGFIYFDAVTSLTEQYSGQVTKNPIDGGGNITDHFTKENPVITLSAVLSGVDISVKGVDVVDDQIQANKPMNDKSLRPLKYTPTQVKNPQKNALIGLLPDVVGRFFKPTRPDINMAVQTPDTLRSMKDLLTGLFSKNGVTLVTMFQYDGNNLRKPAISNLVMTGITFRETPETGNGLFCDITLEQVEFTYTKKEQLPKQLSDKLVAEDLAKKAEGLQNKGAQDSTVQEGASDSATSVIKCTPQQSALSKVVAPTRTDQELQDLEIPCAEEIAAEGFNTQMYIPPLTQRGQ